jgi:hypothetical protein
MPEPILAVDFGAFQTSAALVVGEQWRVVAAPSGGAGWPRTHPGALIDPGPLAGLLAPIRAEAQRQHGGRIQRLALAGVPGHERTLLAAGRAAGFADVELVPDPVAAVLDPAGWPGHGAGEVVLVCDLGASWAVALVRVAGDATAVLAQQVVPPDLEENESRLRWVAETGVRLPGEAGVTPAGVVLVGGWVSDGGVVDQLRRALPGPLRPAVEPELAVLRGVVRWSAGAARRRVPAEPPQWRVAPLSWRIPDQDAQVVRWLVEEGRPFAAGIVLAQVRTHTDRIYDLTATADGALLSHRVRTGGRTGATLVAAVAPAVGAAAYDPPPHRHRWSTTGGWLLTARSLLEWDGTGSYVHLRELVNGTVAGELKPDYSDGVPAQARVFVDASGRFCLLSWNADGRFWVWDIATGALRSRFNGPAGARRVLVDERQWRLAAEVPDSVSVGRYRRTGVVFWDLDKGNRIDKLIDDNWERRHPGYLERSGVDRFASDTTSSDRRLRASADEAGVTLYETATDRPVFRSTHGPCHTTRTAFSADGRFLLSTWDTDDRSTVDVWQL